MRPFRQIEIFSGITRNIFIMGMVSLFTDLSSQMVFPLIPLFLTTVLGCGAYKVQVFPDGTAIACCLRGTGLLMSGLISSVVLGSILFGFFRWWFARKVG